MAGATAQRAEAAKRGGASNPWSLFLLGTLAIAALALIVWPILGVASAFPDPAPPERKVRAVVPSPSAAHVATLVDVSGGGAAGYVYQEVLLRSGSAPARRIAERLYGTRLEWTDDQHLEVACSHGEAGITAAGEVVIRYSQR